MSDIGKVKCLCVDTGLFIPIAQKLAESFAKVFYFSPWEIAFPVIDDAVVGDGFEDIERVSDPFTVLDQIDLAVFPDVLQSGLQIHLERQGIPVWGSRAADAYELNRQLFLRTLDEVGLQVPEHEIVTGLDALRNLLRTKEDCYVKMSRYRGSLETTHWRSWRLDAWLLDAWAMRFGPVGELIQFIVCDAIPTDIECGGDTYCIDGQWPALMLHGTEAKDHAYLGAVTKAEAMPQALKDVMEAFGPLLGERRYRNQFSMEVRIQDDKAFFIDPTTRASLPGTASQIELWKNYAQILWAGAHGTLIEPLPADQFSAEVILRLKTEPHAWGVIEVPEDLRQWMKLSSCCEVDGRICFPPDRPGEGEIGWLVATGNTPKEAIEQLKEYAAALPDGVIGATESLVDVLAEIEKEQEQGIKFSNKPLPEPAEVV